MSPATHSPPLRSIRSTLRSGCRVLDAGCGTGYGVMETGRLCRVGYRNRHRIRGDRLCARAREPPERRLSSSFRDGVALFAGAFDLVTAFEVIEHLADWRALTQRSTACACSGRFAAGLDSEPIVLCRIARAGRSQSLITFTSSSSRSFESALREYFPHVAILFQNRVEAFAFHGHTQSPHVEVRLDVATRRTGECPLLHRRVRQRGPPATSTRFSTSLARPMFCASASNTSVCWIGNSLSPNSGWTKASRTITNCKRRMRNRRGIWKQQNRWAQDLEKQLKDAQERIVQLAGRISAEQAAAAGYARKVAELEQENREKTAWAIETEARLTADLAARAEHLAATVRLLDAAEATVVERTAMGAASGSRSGAASSSARHDSPVALGKARAHCRSRAASSTRMVSA